MKHRAIKPEERELWRATMRGVARHGETRRAVPKPKAVSANKKKLTSPAKAGIQGRDEPVFAVDSDMRRKGDVFSERTLGHTPGLDRRSPLRLKRGRMAIEARLDLHGLTQAEAYRELAVFVARASAAGRRAVLIVTGKGTREGGGVLRAAVPRWLNEPALRVHVLAMTPALPRDGGDGALYLLLRRAR
jgi:DNA-nicking Smr family endonuclease